MRKRWQAIHIANFDGSEIARKTFMTYRGALAYRKAIYECDPRLPKVPVSFTIKIART